MKRHILGFLVLMGGALGLGGVVTSSTSAASDTVTFMVTSNPLTTFDAADGTAVVLPNGEVRFYGDSASTGYYQSWISSDGANFTPEAGNREPAGINTGQEQFFALSNGSYRMYFGTSHTSTSQGIGSAISNDGLNFTVEPGLRITTAQAGVNSQSFSSGGELPNLTSGSVIQLPNGTYRMYFSTLYQSPTGPAAVASNLIESATSTDGLTWTMDPGVRIGPGAPYITSSAEHPSAFVNSDGSVTLFFGRRQTGPTDTTSGLYYSTSTDGLTFTSETELLAAGEFGQINNDPLDSSVVKLPSGQFILFSADVIIKSSGMTPLFDVRDLSETITPAATTTTTVPSSKHKVTIAVTVKGGGLVSGRGVSCPKTCTVSFVSGSSLSLRARPHRGYRFSGWSGPCRGTGVCNFHLTATTKITATFKKT